MESKENKKGRTFAQQAIYEMVEKKKQCQKFQDYDDEDNGYYDSVYADWADYTESEPYGDYNDCSGPYSDES